MHKALEKLVARHPEDRQYDEDIKSYYEKKQITRDIVSERYTREVLYGSVILMLMACAFFLSYIRFSFEAKDLCRRYQFLECMGMRTKQQRKTICRELWPFAWIPVLTSTVSAALFTAVTFRLREYSRPQIESYIKTGGLLAAVYCLVQFAWMICLIHQTVRKVEKSRDREGNPEDIG